MTIPTEYRTSSKVVGSNKIKHPMYVFSVDLSRKSSEQIGPKTNSRTVNLLHPAMSNQSADYGRTLLSGLNGVATHSLLPGFLTGQNIDINTNGTITAYGRQAMYLKKNYADCENPILTLVNVPPYFNADPADTVQRYAITPGGGSKTAGSATVLKNGV